MKRFALLAACLVVVSCGSDTPAPAPTPILSANIVVAPGAVLSLPNCQALANLNASAGNPITSCPSFSAPLLNNGAGCASNVHGTLTVSNTNGQQTGSASWAYASSVRVGEQFVITGGRIDVPTSLSFNAQPTFVWDNVRC
jgi:hypothetical protein